MIVIFSTVPDLETGKKIAKSLVENRVSPCVNIISGIKSIYFWKGDVVEDGELLLIIKSKREMFDRVKEIILNLHPYEVPEIISLPIDNSFEKYREWFSGYLKLAEDE